MITKQHRYHSAEDIHAGDVVHFCGVSSVIVLVNDSGEYLPGFSAADWSELGTGFMVRQENGALIYLTEATEDLDLVERA